MIFTGLPESSRAEILTRSRGRTVALPEGDDPRILLASKVLNEQFSVRCLLGNTATAKKNAQETLAVMEKVSKNRGKSLSPDAIQTAENCFFEAGAMLARGEVDAVVGGACTSTAHVIRAAIGTVGLKPGIKTITSGFLMALKTPTPGGESIMLYADGAVIPQPTSSQLVDIAGLASEAFYAWTHAEPRVAFLSFSTAQSAQHPDVEKVRSAAQEFATTCPLIISEGEIQFDAAVVPEVGLRKNPSSRLQGRANVFVFPNLDAGNIGYKMAQRLAGAEAWGPVLLGAGRPFSDLSRGASELDIIHSVLLTLALGS